MRTRLASGELQALSLVGQLPGDSIAAWDGRQKRLTVFAQDDALGRMVTLGEVQGPEGRHRGGAPQVESRVEWR
jgi:hypothetical protein